MVSTTLASHQQEFLAHILDHERTLPGGWNVLHAAGMDIYRNAYRARLVDALRNTYACTARWVGEGAFQQSAAHHVITHPPKSWTVDDVGEAFPDTLRELFAGDPEVAELGWLEWAMHRCFLAADTAPINAAGFSAATASFEEDDWATMRLTFLPGTHQAPISHDIGTLWKAMQQGALASPDCSAITPMSCVVWREELKPVFIQVNAAEGQALATLLGGASYGEACNALIDLLGEEAAAAQAGAMLGRWLHHGMIAGVSK
jgi:hypothetical protein